MLQFAGCYVGMYKYAVVSGAEVALLLNDGFCAALSLYPVQLRTLVVCVRNACMFC